ncbi:MAG TPA: hypothetical protein VKV27_08300 [Solirubrobacteraceae bacterium]|nr:hypothetical protein [Solirubrobacteraceae bacterium]
MIDRVKEAAERAAARARETVERTQVEHDLAGAYGELGRLAFALAERGALRDPGIETAADRIRALKLRLAAISGPGEPAS